jgi:hypothetical protein
MDALWLSRDLGTVNRHLTSVAHAQQDTREEVRRLRADAQEAQRAHADDMRALADAVRAGAHESRLLRAELVAMRRDFAMGIDRVEMSLDRMASALLGVSQEMLMEERLELRKAHEARVLERGGGEPST